MDQATTPRAVFGSTARLTASTVDSGPRQGADVGDPHTRYAELFARGGVEAGVWTSTPGGWPIENRPDTEVVMIISGRATITDADGGATDVVAGDVFVLPRGWSGRWDIIEDVEKLYVTITEEQA